MITVVLFNSGRSVIPLYDYTIKTTSAVLMHDVLEHAIPTAAGK